ISDNETLSLNPVAYGQMHINLDDDEILNVGINLTGNPQENHSILGNLIAQLCISSNIAESESISPEIIPFAILSGAIAQNCPSMGIGEGLGLLGDVIIQQDHFIVTVKTEIFSVVASQIATLLDTRQIQEISSVFQVSNNKQYGSVMQIGE
ncbi:MAG: hypothetical protein KGI50_06440, partial [Patescibacteria group bacterium]|nr:hypothetical protein [Patescibacteria group bacterium]